MTPDWYIRYALAAEYLTALEEFAVQLPTLVEKYTIGPELPHPSPEVEALVGTQSLQAIEKAKLAADATVEAAQRLNALRHADDAVSVQELEGLGERVDAIRPRVLERLAVALPRLHPERSHASPDLFGAAWFTLVHHVEEAIANGDAALVNRVFSQIVAATFILHDHVIASYGPPTYQTTPALLDPMLDVLELSGLGVIYEALRHDNSAASVRETWTTHLGASGQAGRSPRQILDLLDRASRASPLQMTPRSAVRSEWRLRLAKRIIQEGYGRPQYIPFEERPPWHAPPLFKVLSVDPSMLSLAVSPRVIFAAEVVGPLSGESDEALRDRPGLRRYFEARDHRAAIEDTDADQNRLSTSSEEEVE